MFKCPPLYRALFTRWAKRQKNAYFRPINYISETVEDRHIVTMEDEQEVARAFD